MPFLTEPSLLIKTPPKEKIISEKDETYNRFGESDTTDKPTQIKRNIARMISCNGPKFAM